MSAKKEVLAQTILAQLESQRINMSELDKCEKCGGDGYFTLDGVEVTCAECNDLLGVYEPDTLDGMDR